MISNEDVISAYRLLLDRNPEDDSVVDSWVTRCSSKDELVRGIMGSEEFAVRTASQGINEQNKVTKRSSVKAEPRLVRWLKNLDSIEGWLSPCAAFMSVGLAQLQSQRGYGGNIAEIGVYHGKYLTGLATTLQQGEKAIAIDVFEEQSENADLIGYDEVGSVGIHSLTEQSFLDNAKRYCLDADIVTIKRSSLNLRPHDILEHGGNVRFFSIDGGHTTAVLLNDLQLAEATLAPYGLVSIDDILNPQWPGIVTGAVRFFDGPTKLRPVAFITNKLICAFEPFTDFYRKALLGIAPRSIQRRNVEFSNYKADQYLEGNDIQTFLSLSAH